MLEVADERLVPVEEIDRAVRGHAHGRGAEIRVARADEILDRVGFEARAVVADPGAKNPLHADDVAVQETALVVLRPGAAGEDGRARGRTRRAFPKLLVGAPRLRVRKVELGAQRGRKEVLVVRAVGDDVGAPVVEDFAVRIGEAIGDVALEPPGARLPAIDGAVHIAHRPPRGLDLRAVKDAVAQVDRAAGFQGHRVGLVMGIRGVEAVEHALHELAFAVAIRVARKPQLRRLHDDHAVFGKLKAGRAIEVVEESRALGRLAVRAEVEDEELVAVFAPRRALGVILPRGHPKPALRVPGHLHRTHEFGELHLARHQLHFHASRHAHQPDRLLGADVAVAAVGIRPGLVGFDLRDRRRVRVVDLHVAALGQRPHALLAGLGHVIAHRHFREEHGAVVDLPVAGLVADGRASAVDVVLIDRAVVAVPHRVFHPHRVAQLREHGVRGRRIGGEKRLVDHGRECLVARDGEVDAVMRERGLRALVELLRGGEEIDELHAVRLRDFRHRGRVKLEVCVVRHGVGVIRVRRFLLRDGREEHHARRTLAVELLRREILEIFVEVSLELVQARRAVERLIKTPERQHHVGLHLGQPFLRRRRPVRAHVRGDLIGSETEVADRDVIHRSSPVDERLQRAVVLHPVGERVADDGDARVLAEFELRRSSGVQGGGAGESESE